MENRQRSHQGIRVGVRCSVAIAMMLGACTPMRRKTSAPEDRDETRARLLLCGRERNDALPLAGTLGLTSPITPVAALEWSLAITRASASIDGILQSESDLDALCRPKASRFAFTGDLAGTAAVDLAIEQSIDVEGIELESPWMTVPIPTTVPVQVLFQGGAKLGARAEVQSPVHLALAVEATASGTTKLTVEGAHASAQPPETLDVDFTPTLSSERPFTVAGRIEPWLDVRLYGFVGFRLQLQLDLALQSAETCRATWTAAATVQAIVGYYRAQRLLFASPPIAIPLPAELREGGRDVECPLAPTSPP